MCGINGFISKTLSSGEMFERINKMNQALHHRGPDDTGADIFSLRDGFQAALGQARLSIIDLSPRGHQPMYYTHGHWASNDRFEKQEHYDLAITFNGEIYNYLDVKKELTEAGYAFTTGSDTEVILASYHYWWDKCVEKWNGMWALVLLDMRDGSVFVSRDRLGKKPLYYYLDGERFVFSSELKGILSHEDLTLAKKENINPEAIDFFFTTGYIPAPHTIYKNVKKLEAWHNMLLQFMDGKIVMTDSMYYEIPDFTPSDDRMKLIEDGRNLLEDAVKIRMFSADVPVWAFLSWWLDSSTVVALMTHHVEKEKLHTFSIGFDGKYDETPYVDIVKDAFGTLHHHEYFREGDFEKMIDTIAYHYDEPFWDYSSFPTTFVSRLAREHVTVSLSWDGGDEVFGWYMMHQIAAQMEILYRLPLFVRKFFAKIIPATSNNLSLLSKLREAFRVSTFPKEDFYAELGGSTLYRPESYKAWTREKLRYLLAKNRGNFVETIINFDLLYNTIPDNFLVKVDRASMSQSLEVRSPFLDYRFIKYARTIPTKWKVNTRKTKILMRDIIAPLVPRAIVSRGKKWFEPPITQWILSEKYTSELNTGLEELYSLGIISTEWYEFYRDHALVSDNQVYNVFKIKLFLLNRWKKRWIS